MDFHGIVGLVACPQTLGFVRIHPNPIFLESRVGKTLNCTRRVWNPPFEVGFMV